MSTPVHDARPAGPGSAPALPAGLAFTKGHGTENDFVLVADPEDRADPGPDVVRALCDRRAGVGGDGLVRAVRTAAVAEVAAQAGEAEWFMDYRNADGSVAEMCGNGVRVFAEFCLREGLWPAEAGDGRWVAVATRAGVKRVRREGDGRWTADLGRWRVVGGVDAAGAGSDALVGVRGLDGVARPALTLDLGNPHTVVALASTEELAAVDLTAAPEVEPVPRHGTNVELVVPLLALDVTGDDVADVGEIAMRVHERGSGETRSCGTGACAAALATRVWAGEAAPDVWRVEVPGGSLEVTVTAGSGVTEGGVWLTGPAVLVASGTLAAPPA